MNTEKKADAKVTVRAYAGIIFQDLSAAVSGMWICAITHCSVLYYIKYISAHQNHWKGGIVAGVAECNPFGARQPLLFTMEITLPEKQHTVRGPTDLSTVQAPYNE